MSNEEQDDFLGDLEPGIDGNNDVEPAIDNLLAEVWYSPLSSP
jgi:hypothetical protein